MIASNSLTSTSLNSFGTTQTRSDQLNVNTESVAHSASSQELYGNATISQEKTAPSDLLFLDKVLTEVNSARRRGTKELAHLLEHFNQASLTKLCDDNPMNSEIKKILEQKIKIRHKFKEYLEKLLTLEASPAKRPSCFICFALEPDVSSWLSNVFVPDMEVVDINPVFCSFDNGPGKDLNSFMRRIQTTDKVVLICTPTLMEHCFKRTPLQGSAIEVKYAQERLNAKREEGTLIPVILKGKLDDVNPLMNESTNIFASVLNENGSVVLSYYDHAFELFAAIRGIARREANNIREQFFAKIGAEILGVPCYSVDILKQRRRDQDPDINDITDRTEVLLPTGVTHLDRAESLLAKNMCQMAASHLACSLSVPQDTIQNNLQKFELLARILQQNEENLLDILKIAIRQFLNFKDVVDEYLVPQYQLARSLGDYLHKKGLVEDAMTCYGKATRIAKKGDLADLFEKAQVKAFFLLREQSGLVKNYNPFKTSDDQKRLLLGKNSEQIEHHLKRLYRLKKFYIMTQPDSSFRDYLDSFFDSTAAFFSAHHTAGDNMYEKHRVAVAKYFSELNLHPSTIPTRIYAEKLEEYRQHFNHVERIDDLRDFQRQSIGKFREFIQIILDDITLLLGDPPAGSPYEICFIGSVGKDESLIFSNLEFFFLIGKQEDKEYYENMLHLFKLAILALGETPLRSNITFTVIESEDSSRLHLDRERCPCFGNSDLLGTPARLARLQAPENLAAFKQNNMTFSNTLNKILKASTLGCSSPGSLFRTFLDETNQMLDVNIEGKKSREIRAEEMIKQRLAEFERLWSNSKLQYPININIQFAQFLNDFLAELSIYFAIDKTNTLDIIDELVENKLVTQASGTLFKEAVESIYRLRLRLHLFYRAENDVVDRVGPQHATLLIGEKQKLDEIYWLVLRPLYFALKECFKKNDSLRKAIFDFDGIAMLLKEMTQSHVHHDEHDEMIERIFVFLGDPRKKIEIFKRIYKKISECSHLERVRILFCDLMRPLIDAEALRFFWEWPNAAGIRLATGNDSYDFGMENICSEHPPDQFKLWVSTALGLRVFKKEIYDKLFNKRGEFVGNSIGNHIFQCANKSTLIMRAIENFCNQLSRSRAVSPTELMMFKNAGDRTTKVVVSRKHDPIRDNGGNVLSFGPNLKWEDCDQREWTLAFLLSVLVRPGCAESENPYILTRASDSKVRVVFPDNLQFFVDPLTASTHTLEASEVESTIECRLSLALVAQFPYVKLDKEVLEEFCRLDEKQFLVYWIDTLIRQYDQLAARDLALFDAGTRSVLNANFDDGIPSLFGAGSMPLLSAQFSRLKAFITEKLGCDGCITPLNLVSQLIALFPEGNIFNIGEVIHKMIKDSFEIIPKDECQSLEKTECRGCDQRLRTNLIDVSVQIPVDEKILADTSSRQAAIKLTASKKELLLFQKNAHLRPKFSLCASFKYVSKDAHQARLEKFENYFKALDDSDKPKRVVIRHCAAINSKNLRSFLHSGITYLDLSFCPNIGDSDFQMIGEVCPEIRELHLEGCNGLKHIKNRKNFKNVGFVKLLKLNLNTQLSSIYLFVPLLQQLNLGSYEHLPTARVCWMINPEVCSNHDYISCDGEGFKAIDVKKWWSSEEGRNYRKDREVIQAAVLKDHNNLQLVDEEQTFIIKLIEAWNQMRFKYMTGMPYNDKWTDDTLLKFLPGYSDDREVVKATVRLIGENLKYASPRLQKDLEIKKIADTSYTAKRRDTHLKG